MSATGYPDWQRVSFTSGQQLFNFSGSVTAAHYVTGVFPCAAWGNVYIQCSSAATSDHYNLQTVFFADPGGQTIVAAPFICFGVGMGMAYCIPVMGPYMAIYVQPKVGGNAQAVSISGYGTAIATTTAAMDTFSTPILQWIGSVGASTFITQVATLGYYGKAKVAMDTGTNNQYTIYIRGYDFTSGAFHALYVFRGLEIGRAPVIEVMLPATILEIEVHNDFTTAQSLTCTVIPSL